MNNGSIVVLMMAFTMPPLPCRGDQVASPPVDENAKEVTLTAADGGKVFGTHRSSSGKVVVLLFHQAGSNRHEYGPTVPVLLKWGFDTLAIDQRSGGKMWGKANQTVKTRGGSTPYLEALPDLQAAHDWAVAQKYKTIIVVGSSYSAALVFLLARNNPRTIAGVVSFSPGEYLGKPDVVKSAAAQVAVPIFVTSASTPRERTRVEEVLSKRSGKQSKQVTRFRSDKAPHGASALREDRNPNSAQVNLSALQEFLLSVRRASTPNR